MTESPTYYVLVKSVIGFSKWYTLHYRRSCQFPCNSDENCKDVNFNIVYVSTNTPPQSWIASRYPDCKICISIVYVGPKRCLATTSPSGRNRVEVLSSRIKRPFSIWFPIPNTCRTSKSTTWIKQCRTLFFMAAYCKWWTYDGEGLQLKHPGWISNEAMTQVSAIPGFWTTWLRGHQYTGCTQCHWNNFSATKNT